MLPIGNNSVGLPHPVTSWEQLPKIAGTNTRPTEGDGYEVSNRSPILHLFAASMGEADM